MIYNSHKGFTLIELLVALGIFSVVILAATSVFVMTLQGQRKVLAMQDVQDNARYILDSMSKEIRMMLWVEGIEEGGTRLSIKNSSFVDVIYEFAGGNITRNGQQINSSEVEVEGGFEALGGGDIKSRVIVFMRVKAKSSKPEEQSEIVLQTTISQRNFTTREGFIY